MVEFGKGKQEGAGPERRDGGERRECGCGGDGRGGCAEGEELRMVKFLG